MRLLKWTVVVLMISGMTGAAGFYGFFAQSVPDYDGELVVGGLTAPAIIHTDDFGIPHLEAQNERDLFFAQGYIVARERLFQMDMTRMAGRGELSTLFGDKTLAKDRFLRTAGFYRHAKASYEALSDQAKDVLQAYTDGVNAFIRDGNLPREYVILGAQPKAWAPEDSVNIGLLMGYSLTRSKKIDLVMHQIRQRLGDALTQEIIPSYPDFAPTLAEGGYIFGKASHLPPLPADILAAPTGQGVDIFDGFPFPMEIAASNWMIFSGSMTASGKPLFAGSPDLTPTLPALFYVMHLKAGDINAMGGATPGVPGLGVLSFNGHIATSAVNGRGDELDYFIEKLHPDNSDQYLTEQGYRDFDIREEVIQVKTDDGMREEILRIKTGRHGPIISDVLPNAPQNTAMLWAGLDRPARDVEGLIAGLKARNFDEFRQALSNVTSLNLGLGYADRDGNIGWQFLASTPIRKKGDGSLPVPGWNGDYDWQGYVPFDQVPWQLNPPSGYVASFNNDPGNASYHMSNFYLFERAIRFRDLMAERGGRKVDFADLKAMQLDTVSVVAQRWVPVLKEICKDDEALAQCQALFDGWDFRIDMDSNAATLFNHFYLTFMGNVLKDDVGADIWNDSLRTDYLYYVPDLLVSRLKDQPDHVFFDDRTTPDVRENRDDMIRRSISESLAWLSDRLGKDPAAWTWGNVHQMPFNHPLGEVLTFLNLEAVPTAGSHHTINSGFWNSANPFEMSSGGVIRMMLDFADINSATIISPPGQSGHYTSPHYGDMADIWARGDQVPMHFGAERVLAHKQVLLPVPGE